MASACAPAPLGGVEPWRSAPEVRLAVLSSDEGVQVWALDARAPVRAELEAPEGAELWLLGYRDDTLRAAFPGLAGVDGAALPARLAPRLGGDGGEPTPMADDVLQAVVEPELGLRYTARSWTDWRARAARGLELRLVVDDAAVCGVAQTRELDAPPALEVDDVVALDAGQALAFGRRRDAADAQVQVWRVDADDTWHDLGARPQRGPLLGRPRWDRVTRAAWGVSADGELFLVSPTGLVLPPPPPPALPDVTPRARRLAIGRDGAVFATFPRAYVDNDFGPRVDPALLAYEDGAWRFAPDLPAGQRLADDDAARLPAARPAQDRHQGGLRRGRLWRLHGGRPRPRGAQRRPLARHQRVSGAAAHGARPPRRDRRGPAQGRRLPPGAGRAGQGHGLAVRLLHARRGDVDVRGLLPHRPRRGLAGRRPDVRQPLPLHGLPPHPRSRPGHRRPRPRRPLLASGRRPRPPPPALAYEAHGQRFFAPTTLGALFDILDAHPDHRLVTGATDLGLAVTKKRERFKCLVSLESIAELRQVDTRPDTLSLGAGLSLADVEAITARMLPPLARMLRYFGARQIKNRATLGGNLANASPIGDTPPVLLALGATVVARSRAGRAGASPSTSSSRATERPRCGRASSSRAWRCPSIPADARVGVYKVSKRRELDISAVCAAMMVRVDDGGQITEARVAYGGMAATPARARARRGGCWSAAPSRPRPSSAAIPAAGPDFTPIDDHRGSAWYRQTVAKNLLRGFFEETKDARFRPLPEAPSGTGARWRCCRERRLHPRHAAAPAGAARLGLQAHQRRGDVRRRPAAAAGGAARAAGGRRWRAGASSLRRDGGPLAMPGVRAVLFAARHPRHNLIGRSSTTSRSRPTTRCSTTGQASRWWWPTASRPAATACGGEAHHRAAAGHLTLRGAIAAESWLVAPCTSSRGATSRRRMARGDGDPRPDAKRRQDHFYLETHATLALPEEDGCVRLYSSTQHPTEVQHLVATCWGSGEIRSCEVPRMGGAFGGKESQARTTRAWRRWRRRARAAGEGVAGPRHRHGADGQAAPVLARYEAGFDTSGRSSRCDVEIYADGGWSLDLTGPILDRALFHIDNAYFIVALRFEGRGVPHASCRQTRPFAASAAPRACGGRSTRINRYAERTGEDPARGASSQLLRRRRRAT
jgi:CO/xanthine dehydrogenase FAD-binding subunit